MELNHKIEYYAQKKEMYPLPETMHSAGTIKDPETGYVLAVGFVEYRDTYHKCGYMCAGNVPKELNACVCALFELVQDMPIIKTKLLVPDMIVEKICEKEEATEEIKRYSTMALLALCQAFAGYVKGLKQ